MHIVIYEDPDGGFRSSKSRFWWEVVHNGKSIAESTRADFETYAQAENDANAFIVLFSSVYPTNIEIRRGEEC